MGELAPFLIIGVTSGSVYGLAAMGLVLTYKTSGVFNFAHGAIAAVAAFAFYELHTVRGLPWPVALLLAVVVLPPVVAVGLERVTRGLAGGTVTTKIVATVGLQLAIVSALIAHYGGAGLSFPRFLPTESVGIVGINVGIDQLISAGVAAAAAVAFFVFFRASPTGTRMRAVVDNPELLSLAGTNPVAVRRWAWLIGTWFAAISGVLLAPQIGLDALLLTLLVVQAYGAAAVGLFASLPLTYAGGLLIGVLAALATNLVAGHQWLAQLPPAMPFVVLFVVLLLVPRHKLVEPGAHASPAPVAPLVSPATARALTVAAIAVAAVLPLLVGPRLPVYASALVFVLIFTSLHLLVRISGQISLAHAGLVAIGAATFAHLATGVGLPWLGAVALAGLVVVPVGMIVAVPAIRLAGLFLALATFGFALLLEKVAYPSDWVFGAQGTLPATRPAGFDSDVAFYYVLLAFTVAGLGLVALITRSRLGRLLRALADSPTTLSTLGLGINVTRITVFGLSALIAGVAGALHAAQSHAASATPFSALQSLTWLAVLVLFGPARGAAPVLAALFLVVAPTYGTSDALTDWMPVVFGLGALLVAVHEAGRAQRHAGGSTAQQGEPSRAAERIGAGSAAAERAERAVSRAGDRPGYRISIGTAREGGR
ncbi:ABC transporter permease [Haloechinothrix sp. YIM 98757]|uniref:ABC transporter permease n=1 Tax=Haloechinothrix aidingensis TaxID=2752311 RepID=A0A838ABE0_9PSEU|nr:ABC transporter permease [Haloechinothrix aidingensis]MBA0126551.1 ABC transporter permease [Haloechinothrix aidingensis]